MYPNQAPWTGIGSLQNEISSLKQELYRKADNYEISSFNNRLDSLERSVRDISAFVDEFRSELQEIRENKPDSPKGE